MLLFYLLIIFAQFAMQIAIVINGYSHIQKCQNIDTTGCSPFKGAPVIQGFIEMSPVVFLIHNFLPHSYAIINKSWLK